MNKKYNVELSMQAKEDLKNIVLYIKNELKEPTIAKRYAKLIKHEIKSLEYLPQKNSPIDEDILKDLNIRKLIIKNYIAFYRINESEKIVNVERILYGASNWIEKL